LYCYSVWMRHAIKVFEQTGKTKFPRVAEIGPGYSLGVGLMALITGASEYVAIDKVKFVDRSKVLELFDDLLKLFSDETSVPGHELYPSIKPTLKDTKFPSEIYSKETISDLTNANRITAIRMQLEYFISKGSCEILSYKSSLSEGVKESGKFDLILSQAVLEHVDQIKELYADMAAALTEDGIQSHQIDFKHHKTSFIWNGHWLYTDRQFEIMRGKEPFLINRMPVSSHQRLVASSGCYIKYAEKVELPSSISLSDCKITSVNLEPDDLICSGVYIVCSQAGT